MRIAAFLFLATVGLVVGCASPGEPKQTQQTNNENFSVSVLFTDDKGNTVMRFKDYGRYHYYVVPSGQVIETHGERHGKTTVLVDERIKTVGK